MEVGIKGKKTLVVTNELTAAALGSGNLDVYSTPSMIALMENTAASSVAQFLEDGKTTVGTSVNIRHLRATPVGMKVFAESELVEVDRKRLVFNVCVYDERELIGEGIHERFIIDSESFMNKTNSK